MIVWNITRTCNLSCLHCYSGSDAKKADNEIGTEEAKKILDDLAGYGVPVVLFSGGEPLIRKDIFELARHARQNGLRVVFSTNGTLIVEERAPKIKEIGVSYIGISLDGLEETNDRFRNGSGLFLKALDGIKNCMKHDIKVGLRFTIHRGNMNDIPGIFGMIGEYGIKRICFYHLVNTGRASSLLNSTLAHEETREVLDYIISRTGEIHKSGNKVEVLTVDNHADGPYLILRMKRENHPFAEEALNLLECNRGNNSGTGIGCISWDGEVYVDQFSRNRSLGNVKNAKFGDIWENPSNKFLQAMKDRHSFLPERCSKCRWLPICNGNFRARAEASSGELWGMDPACYLTNEEIFKG